MTEADNEEGSTMSTPIRCQCPYCHHHVTVSYEVEPGRKIRCASCRQVFAYEPQPGLGGTESPLGDSGVKAEAWDEAVTEAKLGDAAEASELVKHRLTISEGEPANDLEKRLKLLERANRRLTAGLALTILLAVAAFFLPTMNSGKVLSSESELTAPRITTPKIVTRELVLVDSDGNSLGGIDSLLGFAQLVLKDSESQCDVDPSSIFFKSDSKVRAVLRVRRGEDTETGMTLHDDTGKIRLWMRASRDVSQLLLSDHTRPLIKMEYSSHGPSLDYAASGRASLGKSARENFKLRHYLLPTQVRIAMVKQGF